MNSNKYAIGVVYINKFNNVVEVSQGVVEVSQGVVEGHKGVVEGHKGWLKVTRGG